MNNNNHGIQEGDIVEYNTRVGRRTGVVLRTTDYSIHVNIVEVVNGRVVLTPVQLQTRTRVITRIGHV